QHTFYRTYGAYGKPGKQIIFFEGFAVFKRGSRAEIDLPLCEHSIEDGWNAADKLIIAAVEVLFQRGKQRRAIGVLYLPYSECHTCPSPAIKKARVIPRLSGTFSYLHNYPNFTAPYASLRE